MTKTINRNVLTIGLMASSISLLVLLQIFWLKNSYDSAYSDLKRETNIVFRETLLDMWDSLVATSITPMPVDSLLRRTRIFNSRTDSSIAIATIENNVLRLGSKDSSSMKVIFSTRDSAFPRDAIRPLVARINRMSDKREQNGNHTFIIRMGSDTIDREKLSQKLKAVFSQNDIDAEFLISQGQHAGLAAEDIPSMHRGIMLRKKRVDLAEEKSSGDQIISEPVTLGPFAEYTVSLEDVRPTLLKRIRPEVFFSFVLTTLTASAFLLMYRNYRSQQRLVSSKNDFINNVTHELKTPVATVSVALEALQNFNAGQDTRLTKEYLEIAQRELTRLNEITDRILSNSVLDNQFVITKETSDLDAVIQKVLSDMKIILDQKKARLSYEKTGSDFSLHCDSYQLYQMIQNLLDNALKYSQEAPVIELSLRGLEKITFCISDHGIGIAKEHQQKIFDKFFRVPTGDIHSTRGYGLGLSYVQHLVRSLGGQIGVESETSKGTKFILTFPRGKVRDRSIRIGKT